MIATPEARNPRWEIWCDRAVISGILFLTAFTPFAFGAVHPWAYTIMEAVIFVLVVVWMIKIALLTQKQSAKGEEQRAASEEPGIAKSEELRAKEERQVRHLPFALYALPLALFLVFVLFQLLPLPPRVLRVLSPQTFDYYTQALPGWPGIGDPVSAVRSQISEVNGRRSAVDDSKLQVRGQRSQSREQGAESGTRTGNPKIQNPKSKISALAAPRSVLHAISSLLRAPRSLLPHNWLPLSLAPALTRADILKFTAYGALFLLILLYPFRPRISKSEIEDPKFSDARSSVRASRSVNLPSGANSTHAPDSLATEHFLRWVLLMVLLIGLMVAATGFIQRFFWNGKILWFFVPYDWGQPFSAGVPRASGPFVNADHFANYLAMIFPMAIAGALYYMRIVAKRLQPAWLTLCAVSAFIVFTGILLSLSRGGWLSALVGLAVVLWVSSQRARSLEQEVPSREHGAEIRRGERLVAQRGEQGAQGEEQSAKSEGHFGWSTKRRSRNSKFRFFFSVQGVRRLLMSRSGILVAVVGVLLITSLFFVGSGGREQVDERLGQTISRDLGVIGRADLWKDTLKMIVDFPLFGVGLGAWPEVFVHYRQPPWSGTFYRAAHNDYVELLAETGVIGFALLGWFFFQIGKRLIQGLERSAVTALPLAAISIAALAAMALHEWFDSNLQIPANAFLFTLLASIGLRMVTEQRNGSWEHGTESTGQGLVGATGWSPGAGNEEQRAKSEEKRIGDTDQGTWNWEPGAANWDQGAWSWEHRTPIRTGYRLVARQKMLVPILGALSAIVLVVCAVLQEQIPYPYNRARPNSLAEAKKLVLSWPASVNAHLSFLLVMKGKTPLSSQLAEAKAALWVEPTNPYVRDFYAATLLSLNRKDEGLKEIARSVGDSPLLRNHFYLAENFLQRLSESEQNAVEIGLNRAVASGYPDAQDSLAGFFVKLNRFADEAALYERMARSEHDAGKKIELFINSAAIYLKAQDESKAELLFRKAIAALPTDPRPYQELATRIYGRKDFLRAQEIVSQGIKNGAPAFSLYLSLAEAAQTTGNPSDRKRALSLAKTEIERAAKQVDDPYPFYLVLADASRKIGDRDQEVAALLKLLEFRPQSLDTLSRLAKVYFEQRNFDRAALYFSRIINIQPDTAEVYHHLAVAEEGRYHFAAADNAYARAVALDPDNAVYRERYEEFRKRIERNKAPVDGKGRGLGPAAGSREPGARS